MDLFAPPEHNVRIGDQTWQTKGADSLKRNGFCALRGSPIDKTLLAECLTSVEQRLDVLLSRVSFHGFDLEKDEIMFKEFCKRMHHRRFDVRLPAPGEAPWQGDEALPQGDVDAWTKLHAEAHRKAWPVLQAQYGLSESDVQLAGCVVSLPGSSMQNYHQDGSTEGFFNVFVPLVDVTEENGPTEFLPGSQVPVAEGGLSFAAAPRKPVAPTLDAGEIMIFDYRVRHRGLGNGSCGMRPVAYLVYTPRGLSDVNNFKEYSLFSSVLPIRSKHQEALGDDDSDYYVEAETPAADTDSPTDGAPSKLDECKASKPVIASTETSLDVNRNKEDSWWERLRFQNATQQRLGVDGCSDDVEYREIRGACFAAARPTRILKPRIVCLSSSALALLDVDPLVDQVDAEQLCGNEVPTAAAPAAHCYCGYQYGTFSGQLGDGAALSLGEVMTSSGKLLELNLKGTGVNPLTRYWYIGLNGRKSTSAMVRECLVAEALCALEVPSTRALAVISGQDSADKKASPCAVLLRAADTFLRFGSFEVTLPHSHGHHAPSGFDWSLLRKIADHCISSYYEKVLEVPDEPDEEDEDLRAAPRYCEFLLEVTRRTARLVAAWQCLGAVHGMLNTDNMSVVGVSLDHGSFAFVDHFDPRFAGFCKEAGGRYCYRDQPDAAKWACERLAEALLPLHCTQMHDMKEQVTNVFDSEFASAYGERMRQKLGLGGAAADDLSKDLVELMERTAADWTCTFRALTVARSQEDALLGVRRWCRGGAHTEWDAWLSRYTASLADESLSWDSALRVERMCAANPVVVPREWILSRAVQSAEVGDFADVQRILELLTKPFEVPADSSYSNPLGYGLDEAKLSQLGTRAAEMLSDAEYWRRIVPELHVCSEASAGKCAKTFSLGEQRLATLRASMGRDGVCNLSSDHLPWAVELRSLAEAVEKLHAAGWPPSFLWVYDEPWILMSQIATLLKDVMGADLCLDVSVQRFLPGAPGFAPRRDRPLSGYKSGDRSVGVRSDGTTAFTTCWIPLVDVPSTSSCLMCVPRTHDSGYMETENLHWGPEMLHNIRPLSMNAGNALMLSHRLLHWGKTGDSVNPDGSAASPCAFLTFAVADDAFEKVRMPRQLLPLPPLQTRVALTAGQTLLQGSFESYGADIGPLLWECFLACSDHLDSAFGTNVFKASPLAKKGN
eukprot:TRINITY_DN26450_c0_g1_i1.p1 TRINITY_DN26450_c0_g1~~TRINITY_DN26450_c0_g1_i1.p1  ORF type:complete len:1190 (-),score=160.04 TRINITY_DN26450_c0_g1_i1:349-3891(-)